jgi:hypothetical protein
LPGANYADVACFTRFHGRSMLQRPGGIKHCQGWK